MKRATHTTEQAGVHTVGLIFTKKLGWIFREQHGADYGIDAQVEVMSDGKATGKLLALQIKSGQSYFKEKGDGYVYRGDPRHLTYWLNHTLPVLIVIHDPENGVTLWEQIERSRCTVGEKTWSIVIPKANVLDESASEAFLALHQPTPEESRRQLLHADLDMIEDVSKFGAEFTLDVDDDPEIGLTEIGITCRDREGRDVFRAYEAYGGGAFTVHEVMQQRYWFLDYEYAEDVTRYDDSERHVLDVTVKPEVMGFLAVEKILRDGPPPTEERETPYEEPSFEEQFREALELDWQAEQHYDRDDSDGG